MKRAIYVGKTGFAGFRFLSYGMTGVSLKWHPDCMETTFMPDGERYHIPMPRNQIYIPSEDQQRHCPKPA